MKRLNVSLEDDAYAILSKYRDSGGHRSLDQAINALIREKVRRAYWPEEQSLPDGWVIESKKSDLAGYVVIKESEKK
jgi:uncharacterized protein YbdZ (MbtH family)